MSRQRFLPISRIFTIAITLALVAAPFAGFVGVAAAGPAPDDYHTLTQPNGEEFDAKQWGNEFNHGWEAENGYTITKGEEGWWWYATLESGKIAPTDRKVGIDDPPNVPKHLRGEATTSPELTESLSPDGSASGGPSAAQSASAMPSTGDVNLPVVMINYTDTTTTYTVGDFDGLLFGDDPDVATGPGSMKEFYNETSHGQLSLSGGTDTPTGWYTSNNEHDYYGSSYTNAAELAKEAVRKSDSDVDYSQYDNNNDGYVDGVIVIHQGPGEEASGDSTDIWSHRWSFYGAGIGPYNTNDGVTVNSYSLQPETYGSGMTTMGIIAHESGHLFGMTDLYDTNGGSEGIGEWGLMGSGSWNWVNRPGDSPAHLTAYHKYQMGWISPTDKSPTGKMGSLSPYATNDEVYRWFDDSHGSEYFLAANRQQVGFEKGLPGEGLIITHIDESQYDNTNEDHKLVDIEAADGDQDLDDENNRGDTGDPFPGWTDAHAFNSTTTPSSHLYGGSQSGLEINEIYVSGDEIILNPDSSIQTNPSPVDYGTVHVSESQTETVTVENVGSKDIEVTGTSITGTNASAYSITSGGGQTTISPDSSTTVDVELAPAETGEQVASLVVEHNGSDSPTTVDLTGTGIAPDYEVRPSETVEYGEVALENGTDQQSITVTNNGSAPLNVTDATFTTGDTSHYSLGAESETTPSVVAPGSSVTYDVNFTIDSLSTKTATLELSHNVSDRPTINLTLNGTGADLNPPNVASGTVVNQDGGAAEVGPGDTAEISAAVTDAVSVDEVTVNASALGAGTVTLTDGNGDDVYDATVSVDGGNAIEGHHALDLTATDTKGHSMTTGTDSVAVDLSAPDLTIDVPADGHVQNETSLTVTSTATDATTAVETVEVNVNGTGWNAATLQDGTWQYEVSNLAEGQHSVSVRATDNVSNTGTEQTAQFTTDYTIPSIDTSSLNETESILPEAPILATVTASDDVSSVATVMVDETELSEDSGTWSGTPPAASALGTRTATVTVIDAGGNRQTETIDYAVGRNATLTQTGDSSYSATPSDTPVVKNVSMNVTADANAENVTVGTSTANPTQKVVDDNASVYFPQVNTTVANENISEATITVELAKSRFDELYVYNDTATFWAYDGTEWSQTTATLTNVTNTTYRFEIATTHFSAFAVTGEVEDEPPTITKTTPANGDETTDKNPDITVNYTDGFSGIDASSITFSVNGNDVTENVSASASGLTYSSSLGTGSHSATVVVSDNADNVRTHEWNFEVESNSGGGGGGGDIEPPSVRVDVTDQTDTYAQAKVTSARLLSPAEISFDGGLTAGDATVRGLTVTPASTDAQARFFIQAQTSDSAPGVSAFEGTGQTLGYMTVTPTYISDEELDTVAVQFAVDEELAGSPENVALYRFDGGSWSKVSTEARGQQGGAYQFEASAEATGTFAVGLDAPAFEVQEASLDATEVAPGDEVQVSGTVENVGSGESSHEVELVVDGETVATEQVTLAAGEETTVEFTRTFDAGEYAVAVGSADAGTLVVSAETTEAAMGSGENQQTRDGDSNSGGIPGFGVPAALVALLGAALFARRAT
jgi:M6 family metalloprotease-like protein/PGF-pre-PGF domain-containing protein/PGF-CTERM protein